jgi:glutamate-ammonia-ligase adenylyltransferase
MAEILIRDPGYLYWLTDPQVLERSRARDERRRDLSEMIAPLRTDEHRLEALRIFKRRELLHIGVRDLLRLATVDETVAALSELAEILIEAALEVCQRSVLGGLAPAAGRDSELVPRGFTVIGMGKLGGGELNFSSDVDLIYVSADEPQLKDLAAVLSIPLPEYFERVARTLTSALSAATNEGSVYRVDLRLRPEGRAGGLVTPLSALRDYYATRGATWERLALLKAWPVAGDMTLAREFLETVEPFVFRSGFGPSVLADIREMKERIHRKIAERDQTHTHVKLGLGGIREIEIVVQTLQLAFAEEHPRLRQRATLPGLAALAEADVLTAEEHRALAAAYRFLRDVENKLQMVHDVQSHALPTSAQELRRCALRLGYRDAPELPADQTLTRDYERHTRWVNAFFRKLFDPDNVSRFWPGRAGP